MSSTFPHIAIHHVAVADTSNSDLLSHLEVTTRFLREGVAYGAVLVHCYHGVSRSAAVVAAYLMKTRKNDPDFDARKAVDLIRASRPSVQPNDGFMRQLGLWRAMGCKLDFSSSQAFKLYRLQALYERVKVAGILPRREEMIGNASSGLSTPSSTNSSCEASLKPKFQTSYKCKKCRTLLAGQKDVLPHIKGQSASCETLLEFDARAKSSSQGHENEGLVENGGQKMQKELVECRNGIFVEPVRWMNGLFVANGKSGLAEKLRCPKCKSKIGSFSWVGRVQCGCGGGLAPGFIINLSKVDKCTMFKEIEADL